MENSNKSAFPNMETDSLGNPLREHLGLSKREYFAGLAMQGILSSGKYKIENSSIPILSEASLLLADGLLKQLDNG